MAERRYSINIKTTDFKAISDIEMLNIETIGFTWVEILPNSVNVEEQGQKIAQIALELMLVYANQDKSGIRVGKSSIRVRETKKGRRKKDDKIDLIVKFNNSRIGGIVGALSGTVSALDIMRAIGKDSEIKLDEEILFNINLQVRSRMDTEKSWYFLSTILNYGNLKSHSANVFENMDEVYDFLLVDLLADNIRKTIPKGHYRTYQRFERNDDKLKGTIDIARHIKLNAGQDNGFIAYSFRENSVDNKLNRLLVASYKHLKEKFPQLVEEKLDKDNEIKDYLNVLLYQIDSSRVDTQRIILDNSTPISHPFYSEYEDVRRVCLRILRDVGMSIFDSTSGSVKGFLYYLPDIWEDFLLDMMRSKLKNHCDVLEQETYNYVSKADGQGFICEGRPDYILSRNEKPVLILDAKFKPGWKDDSVFNPQNDIDKCIRDMVVVKAKGTGIIYPFEIENDEALLNEMEQKRKRIISELNGSSFYFYPVGIPKAKVFGSGEVESFESWKENFDNYINRFLCDLERDVEEYLNG